VKKARVYSGLDRLDKVDGLLRGRRVGLMTNPTGINRDFYTAIDLLHGRYQLTALFACEHGIRGTEQAGDQVTATIDPETGVTVYSLYGDTQRMTKEMLDAFDVLVFDMQDVGARFYTYLYSLSYAMEACAGAGKPVVVLDRINPLGGARVQGTVLDEAFASFVGAYALPTRYGLTIGEYALWAKAHLGLDLELFIVPLEGWRRDLLLDDLDIPWVIPSPNCPLLATGLCFVGPCVFEGANLSEGRGTTTPFELVGAPWVDAGPLEAGMRALALPGVGIRRACFTPTFSKHANTLCHGVQLHITDRNVADPFVSGLYLLDMLRRLFPDSFEWLQPDQVHGIYHADRILGTDAYRTGKLDARSLIAFHEPLLAAFQEEKRAYHLY